MISFKASTPNSSQKYIERRRNPIKSVSKTPLVKIEAENPIFHSISGKKTKLICLSSHTKEERSGFKKMH